MFLDGTVVNVALPALQEDLGASLAAQQWVVESYLLTLSSLLLVGGSLDDLFERRTVFASGVAGFGVTSLLCAIAPDRRGADRGARAAGRRPGALLVPSTLALIIATFPPEERGAAIGSWTAWAGISTVLGPLGGGVADRQRVVALDLRDQRHPGGDHAVADRRATSRSRPSRRRAAASTSWAACCARSAWAARSSR